MTTPLQLKESAPGVFWSRRAAGLAVLFGVSREGVHGAAVDLLHVFCSLLWKGSLSYSQPPGFGQGNCCCVRLMEVWIKDRKN